MLLLSSSTSTDGGMFVVVAEGIIRGDGWGQRTRSIMGPALVGSTVGSPCSGIVVMALTTTLDAR